MEYPKYQRIVSSFVSSLGSSDRFPHAPGAASEASETRGIEKKNRNRVSGGTRAGSNNCVATDVALMMLFHLPRVSLASLAAPGAFISSSLRDLGTKAYF